MHTQIHRHDHHKGLVRYDEVQHAHTILNRQKVCQWFTIVCHSSIWCANSSLCFHYCMASAFVPVCFAGLNLFGKRWSPQVALEILFVPVKSWSSVVVCIINWMEAKSVCISKEELKQRKTYKRVPDHVFDISFDQFEELRGRRWLISSLQRPTL